MGLESAHTHTQTHTKRKINASVSQMMLKIRISQDKCGASHIVISVKRLFVIFRHPESAPIVLVFSAFRSVISMLIATSSPVAY